MDSLATVEEFQMCVPYELSEQEADTATDLLLRATAKLMAEFKRCGVEIEEDDDVLAVNAQTVCIEMVKRCLMRPNQDETDFSSSFNSDPFAMQSLYPNEGRLYIRNDERVLLGIPKRCQRIGGMGI